MIADLYKNDKLSRHIQPSLRTLLKRGYISIHNYMDGNFYGKNNFSIQFLYGHYLFSDELTGFDKIMKYITDHFHVISYSEAVSRLQSGEIDNSYVCFSFDDGIKNCMRIAERYYSMGISAMFFLNPNVVDHSSDQSYLKQHCEEKLHLKELDFMGWKEVEQLLKMNHEVGNHTNNHARLSAVDTYRLEEEIAIAKMKLEAYAGKILHFAWPYGKVGDMTRTAFEYAIKTGHTSIASAVRGQHFAKLDLTKEYLLRDLVVFREPLPYLKYFYYKANRNADTIVEQLS